MCRSCAPILIVDDNSFNVFSLSMLIQEILKEKIEAIDEAYDG